MKRKPKDPANCCSCPSCNKPMVNTPSCDCCADCMAGDTLTVAVTVSIVMGVVCFAVLVISIIGTLKCYG